jgi:hypothetical protein
MPAVSAMVNRVIIGLPGTKAASNPHSQRPPQTPAASFKSPYRKRLGSRSTSSPRLPCAEAFPMKASDFPSTWITFDGQTGRTLTRHIFAAQFVH